MLLALALVAVAAISGRLKPDSHRLSTDLQLAMSGVTAAVTMIFGALLASLVPIDRRPTGIYLGLGVMLLGTLAVGVGELGATLFSESWASLPAVRGWSLVIVFGCLALGVVTRQQHTFSRLAPGLVGLAATAIVVVSQFGLPIPHALEVAWSLVVVAQLLAFSTSTHTRYLWVAVALLSFMLAEVELATGGATGQVEAHVVRILGVGLSVAGLVVDMVARVKTQQARVADLQQATREARQALEERDHEARSALAAIEFTAYTLRRKAGSLDQAALAQLELAFTAELALLRRMLTLPDVDPADRGFRLRDPLAGIAAAAEARGVAVDLGVDPDLNVAGTPEVVAEIAQVMLDNARVHAPGSPVRIWARSAADYVVVHFDDHGPGVPPDRRTDVFRRGRDGGHATSAWGRGLGLYVAQRLAGELGGELWVEASPGGGASFRLSLRAAPSAQTGSVPSVPR